MVSKSFIIIIIDDGKLLVKSSIVVIKIDCKKNFLKIIDRNIGNYSNKVLEMMKKKIGLMAFIMDILFQKCLKNLQKQEYF